MSRPSSPSGEHLSMPTLDEGSNVPTRFVAAESRPETGLDDPRWERRGALGWGGMGRVMLAFDRVLGREVALKEPTSELDERLFLRECLITARLEHPGIVPIYEVGRGADGRPWFSMRVVRGRSLSAILAEHPDSRARLRLLRHLRAAAEAVAFAHAAGVVHRDLKPANLMVGAFGETQVIDWGLASARGLGGDAIAGGGTPSAMSPEQVRGEPQGPASDVWSLGLILWHLVAGRPPLEGLEREALLARIAGGTLPDLRQAAPGAPEELVAIVRRALAPSPSDRYPDAAALADDLGRFIDGGLVSAHDYSAWAMFGRLLRAWKVPIAVGAVAALVIAVLLALGFAKVSDERRRSEANLALSLVASARQALSRDARGEAEVLAAHALARAELPEARGVLLALPAPRPGRVPLGATPCTPIDLIGDGAGARVLCRREDTLMMLDDTRPRWSTEVAGLRGAAFYARGEGVAVLEPRGIVRLDATTGAQLGPRFETNCGRRFRTSPAHEVAFLSGAACASHVSRDGALTTRLLCDRVDMAAHGILPDEQHHITLCKDGQILVQSLGDHDVASAVPHRAPGNVNVPEVYTLAATPGGDILYGTNQGEVYRAPLDAPHAELLGRGQGLILAIDVTRSGRLAAFTWEVGPPLIVDLASKASLGRVAGPDTHLVTFVDDTDLLAVGEALTRLDFGAVRPRAYHFDAGIAMLAVSPDGQRLAVASGGTVTVLETATRRRLGDLDLGAGFIKTLAFHASGAEVMAHTLRDRRVHGVRADGVTPIARVEAEVDDVLWRAMAALPDGTLLGAAYSEGLVRVTPARWPSGSPRPERPRPEPLDTMPLEYLVADRERVGALGVDQLPRLGEGLGGEGRLEVCDSETVARAIAVDADAPGLVVALPHGLELRCPRDGLRYLVEGTEAMFVAAGSGYLAAGARDGSVWLWRRGDPTPLAVFRHHSARVEAMVFDPKGRWLAAGGWDGEVAFFDLPADPMRWAPPDPGSVESAWGLELGRILGSRPLGATGPERP